MIFDTPRIYRHVYYAYHAAGSSLKLVRKDIAKELPWSFIYKYYDNYSKLQDMTIEVWGKQWIIEMINLHGWFAGYPILSFRLTRANSKVFNSVRINFIITVEPLDQTQLPKEHKFELV